MVVDAPAPPAGLPGVATTNWVDGLAATKHLLGLGHRRIAAIIVRESTATLGRTVS